MKEMEKLEKIGKSKKKLKNQNISVSLIILKL